MSVVSNDSVTFSLNDAPFFWWKSGNRRREFSLPPGPPPLLCLLLKKVQLSTNDNDSF